ncbi:MAG TPA: hypothetical protein DEH78_00430 [Solibacterales bacterium]|nr:hypothetical protein [Bryobacterales bacterium]
MVTNRLALFWLAVAVWAQPGPPRIGTIEFFGAARVSQAKLREALHVKEGDPLPRSKGELEEALEAVGGVVRANVEAQCCEDGKAVLYIGIEERGGPRMELRDPPAAELSAPEAVHEAYQQYLEAVSRAPGASEDLRQGHAVSSDIRTGLAQERFIGLADLHEAELRKVLREAAGEDERAMAATVLGYTPRKRAAVADLQYAMQDPSGEVRRNAMRSLAAIYVFGAEDAELDIRVQPTWFVEMLHSIEWRDRQQAARALSILTDKREEKLLQLLRERALRPLIEMASWKNLEHALPAYLVLGRAIGTEEKPLLEAWALGKRDGVLQRARKALR